MKEEGEIYIDPAQPPEKNAKNLRTLRELREHFARLAQYEANADVALEMLDHVWTLDEVIEKGESMARTLDREAARAGDYVELFSGRFYEVRPDGWGSAPLRVHDLRRRSFKAFSTPEAANGYAHEQESGAAGERRRMRATVLLAAAGLLVVFVLSAWRWL